MNTRYSRRWFTRSSVTAASALGLATSGINELWLPTRPALAQAAPLLTVESPVSGAPTWGVLHIAGWAAHPAAKTDAGIDEVAVFTSEGPGKGQRLSQAFHGLEREDVVGILGGPQFAKTGFRVDVNVLPLVLDTGATTVVVGARSGKTWATTKVDVSYPKPWDSAVPVQVGKFDFMQIKTDSTITHFRPKVNLTRVAYAIAGIEYAAPRAAEMTGLPALGQSLPLYLFPDHNAYINETAAILKIKPQQMGRFAGGTSVGPGRDAFGYYADFSNDGVDHYMHRSVNAYLSAMQEGPLGHRDIGTWFMQGMSDYVASVMLWDVIPENEFNHSYWTLRQVGIAHGANSLYPMTALEDDKFWFTLSNKSQEEFSRAHAQATRAAYKLTERTGVSRIWEVFTVHTNAAHSWSDTFKITFGQTLTEFEQEYVASIPDLFPTVIPEMAPAGRSFSFLGAGFRSEEAIEGQLLPPSGQRFRPNALKAHKGGLFSVSFTSDKDWPRGQWGLKATGKTSGHTVMFNFTVQD